MAIKVIAQRCGNGQVEGCGDFDVFTVAEDKGDGMSEAFHNGSIVGEEVGVGLLVGLAEKGGGKDLRGLDKSVVGTGNCHTFAIDQMANGFHHFDDRYDGFRTGSFLVSGTDGVERHERTHAIMHPDQLGIRGDEGKSVLDGVETGFAAIGKGVGLREMVFIAERAPVFLLTLGQDKHHLHLLVILEKTVDGAHQNGLTSYGQKLLGNVTSHAKSLATCYYDYCFQDKLKVKN